MNMTDIQIILDESKENPPADGFKVVETEIEFLQFDGAQKLWARGKVCDLVRIVCQARKIKFTQVSSPRVLLRSIIGDVADQISSDIIDRCLKILKQNKPQTLADLIYHLTEDEFWITPISEEHAAQFLTIKIDENLHELAEEQRNNWAALESQNPNLREIYQCSLNNREDFLLRWLLDEETRKNLGEFPLLLGEKNAQILSNEIRRQLRTSEGAAVSEFPRSTVNRKIYAKAAIDYFSHHSTRLSASRLADLSPVLSSSERTKLEKLLPKNELTPLDITADVQTALSWATDKYLPFRDALSGSSDCAEADNLASSFAEWILKNYPKLTHFEREDSPINWRTYYTVKKLLELNYWVLWVVVDGLNYINHQELLRLLGEKSANLRVAEDSRVLAVLPTITSRAKYGLTSGNFPSENINRDFDPKNAFFAKFPNGIYAGNTGMPTLANGLKIEEPTVCYWNFTKIDKCFHDHTDTTFLKHDINTQLRGLADNINQLVLMAHDINRVAVVICSDHGQMINHCKKSQFDSGDRYVHGRTALDNNQTNFEANEDFIKSDSGETVYLNPTSFRLSEPTTVALGSTYFVDLKATEDHGAIGVHGGLFPEEVVVGLAVLMRQPSHEPLSVTASGTGEADRSGVIVLSIDNPNFASVNPLSLTIDNIKINDQGELLLAKVGAQEVCSFEVPIEKFPAPTEGEEFQISGILRYEFEDGTNQECDIIGKLICKSLYIPKNPSLLNRFKK